jgi:hypothetical protein
LTAPPSPYALIGYEASVRKASKLLGGNASYVLVQFDASTRRLSRISAAPRQIVLTGNSAAFLKAVFAFGTLNPVIVVSLDGLAFSNAYLSAVDGVTATTAVDTLAPTTTTLENITDKYTQSSSQQTTTTKTTSTTIKGNPSGTSQSSTVVGP